MTYRIINLDAFGVVGIKGFTSLENSENFTKIPQMWADLPDDALKSLGAKCPILSRLAC